MLLVTGADLDRATVTTSYAGVSVARTQAGASSHYLFVWLKIAPQALPGSAGLQVRTAGGEASLTFPLLPPPKNSSSAGVTPDDTIYLIMPDRFADGNVANDRPAQSTGTYDRSQPKAYHGGDLQGIRDHLPYLHDLGVNTLWLTPVWKNTDSDYHGYHVVDFYAIDDHMGTLDDYRGLVRAAHQLGMKVLIDYVVNHTGPKDAWASDPPAAGWFHGTPQSHLPAMYNFNPLADPHSSPRDRRNVLDGWFVDKLPDLDPDNPLLAEYLAENALWWNATAELDGFRLDTFPYSTRQFWSGWHGAMRDVFPRLFTIGEVSDPDPAITAFFAGGRKQFDGIDSGVSTVFDFPLFYALRDVLLHGAPVARLLDVLRRDYLYPDPGLLVTFLGNHDQKRFMGEPGASLQKLNAASALLLTLRGIPEIYAGDEVGMPGGEDPDNRRDFPGGFPGDPRNAFTAAGRTPPEQQIFQNLQSLLSLRRDHPALRNGQQWNIGSDETYYAFLRETAQEKLLIVFNAAPQDRGAVNVPLDGTRLQKASHLTRLFGAGDAHLDRGSLQLALPATSVSVYSVE
jgi:glycosidase